MRCTGAYRWLRHVEHVLQLEGGLQTQTRARRRCRARSTVSRAALGYADATPRSRPTLGRPHRRGRRPVRHPRRARGRRAADRGRIGAPRRGELTPEPERGRAGARSASSIRRRRARELRARAQAAGLAAGRRPRPARAARVGGALLAEIARVGRSRPGAALRRRSDRAARRARGRCGGCSTRTRRCSACSARSSAPARTWRARWSTRPELIDLLVEVGEARRRDRTALERDADRRRPPRTPPTPATPRLAWSALAEFKNGQVLRVGLADFAGALDAARGVRRADRDRRGRASIAALRPRRRRAASSSRRAPRRRRHAGAPRGARPRQARRPRARLRRRSRRRVRLRRRRRVRRRAAAAGGRVLHAPAPSAWSAACTPRTPRGRLYEIDTRLRPSGSQGLLVSSLAGWRRYHAERRAAVGAPGADQAAAGRRRSRARRRGRRRGSAHGCGTAPPPLPARAIAAEIVGDARSHRARAGQPAAISRPARAASSTSSSPRSTCSSRSATPPGAAHAVDAAGAARAARAAGVAPFQRARAARSGLSLPSPHRAPHARGARSADPPLARRRRRAGQARAPMSGSRSGDALRERVERWQRDIRAAFALLACVAVHAHRVTYRSVACGALVPVGGWYEARYGHQEARHDLDRRRARPLGRRDRSPARAHDALRRRRLRGHPRVPARRWPDRDLPAARAHRSAARLGADLHDGRPVHARAADRGVRRGRAREQDDVVLPAPAGLPRLRRARPRLVRAAGPHDGRLLRVGRVPRR